MEKLQVLEDYKLILWESLDVCTRSKFLSGQEYSTFVTSLPVLWFDKQKIVNDSMVLSGDEGLSSQKLERISLAIIEIKTFLKAFSINQNL